MFVDRFAENPLITPQDVPPSRNDYEVVCAFNPGVTRLDDEILLLLRVAERPLDKAPGEEVAPILNPETGQLDCFRVKHGDPDLEIPDSRSFRYKGQVYLTSISHLRIARSKDGIHFKVDSEPAVFPEESYETFGLEDPRITQIGGEYYIAYKVVNHNAICTALLKTKDFVHFERLGIIFCPENLDVALFPEKIDGRYYAIHRPVPRYIGRPSIWLAGSEDVVHWGRHTELLPPRSDMFDSAKTGGSCVPIKTKDGWLEIYHASDHEDRYTLAAVLLDLEDPSRVLARSQRPLMQPEAEYEVHGFYGNVVFACGAVEDGQDVLIYYGAADEYTAGARTTVARIMSTME